MARTKKKTNRARGDVASSYVMKTVAVSKLSDPVVLAKVLAATKTAPVVVRSGKRPVAIICAVPANMDLEDVYWATDPGLQEQIRRSRASGTRGIPTEAMNLRHAIGPRRPAR